MRYQGTQPGRANTPAELTDKLIFGCRQIVETEMGYAFEYDRSYISLAELTDWVVAEGKCCSFFDFHIDVEREGSLLHLQLTGPKGVKPFIQLEFKITSKTEGDRQKK